MSTWSEDLFSYYTSLNYPADLPHNIEWLFPQKDPEVQDIVKRFLAKYYKDHKKRRLLLGINPGRFGAGVTGVNFTAPNQLKEVCGIEHSFKPRSELSAEFIYSVIEAYGGAEKFYSHFFIGSVCPLGFVQGGKNLNYYDDKELWKTVKPFIVESISKLCSFNIDHQVCICIGGEKNFRFLSGLNNEHHWFEKIVTLPHPRFIMQYKRKHVEEYIKIYLEVLAK